MSIYHWFYCPEQLLAKTFLTVLKYCSLLPPGHREKTQLGATHTHTHTHAHTNVLTHFILLHHSITLSKTICDHISPPKVPCPTILLYVFIKAHQCMYNLSRNTGTYIYKYYNTGAGAGNTIV